MKFPLRLPPCQVFSTLGILVHLIQGFSNLTSHLKPLSGMKPYRHLGPLLDQLNQNLGYKGLQVSLMSNQVKNH